MNKIIKWTNIYSGEVGYVKSINKKEGHFINTTEIEEAKVYTEQGVKTAITMLVKMGEGRNNKFETVDFVKG